MRSVEAATCPECGVPADADSRVCGACGHVRFGTLVLRSDETRKELRFSVPAEVGQRLLRTVLAEESRYASEPQFSLRKDRAVGGWVLEQARGARNPTFVDGAPVDAPREIDSGAVISIGPERLRLTVEVVE